MNARMFHKIWAVLAALALLAVPALAEGDSVSAMVEEAVPEVEITLDGPEDVVEPPLFESVETLALAASSVRLGVGERFALYDGAAMPTFSTSNKKVAAVGEDGVIKAVKRGKATVTAKLGDSIATCAVTVVKAPSSVTLSKKSAVLGCDANLGESLRLTATLSKGSASAIAYTSSDPSVIDVDADGTVYAVGVGSATVTASTYNGKTATASIEVRPAPQAVELDAQALTLGAGESHTLCATPVGGYCSAVKYTSDNPDCVSVDGNGKLTALAEGTANIRAEAFNGAVGCCAVTVNPAPTKITGCPSSITIGVGETRALNATTDIGDLPGGLTYSSAKPKLASVSASGVVKGLKKGVATVKITAYNGVSMSVKVTVKAAPGSISVSPKSMALELGTGGVVKASLPAKTGGGWSFESADPSVASVDAEGLVVAEGIGETEIVARSYNGKTARCAVKVYGPAAAIHMPGEMELVSAQYSDCQIEVLDASGGAWPGEVSVSFEPEGVADYSEGRLLGLTPGKAAMTVSAGAVSRSCAIRVVSYKSVHGVKSIAHRGGCGYWPENTLEAFRNVASTGADGVELDARGTSDGVQVIHHDATLKAGSKTYKVVKLTYKQLKKLKPSVCTLDEALDVLGPTGLKIHLELKNTADGGKCVKAIQNHGLAGRTVYFSFYETQLKQVYGADPSAKLGMSMTGVADPTADALFEKARRLHIAFFVANKALMTQELTDLWHRMGYEISVWTPNTRAEVKKLCDMGVDYILSDYPDYCVELR